MGRFTNEEGEDITFLEAIEEMTEEAKEGLSKGAEKWNKKMEEIEKEQEDNKDDTNPQDRWNIESKPSERPDDVQQWEYKTFDLVEDHEANILESMIEQQGNVLLPPDEVLNELGKDGWELVETVERPALEVGSFTEHEGTMTFAFIFRRPASYQD